MLSCLPDNTGQSREGWALTSHPGGAGEENVKGKVVPVKWGSAVYKDATLDMVFRAFLVSF